MNGLEKPSQRERERCLIFISDKHILNFKNVN
jgi:hypothetical protein